MSRRLVGRNGRPAASASASANIALPEYQPPSCPLDASAGKALGEISRNRGTASYEAQLKESLRHLGHSVADLNERLLERRQRLAQLQRQRRQKETDKLPEEERLGSHLPDFRKQVDQFTIESEQALRQIIDQRAELEDEAGIIGDLFASAVDNVPAPSSSRRRRGGDEEDEEAHDDKKESTVPCLVGTFKKRRSEKRSEYNCMSSHQRYALHNDYVGFKKLWHDAAVGDDGPPLPDASKWFLPSGEPDMSISSHGRRRRISVDGDGGDEDEDEDDNVEDEDDDEIAIQREKVSMKCPLTLLLMDEPYKNSKCPHVFERSAIFDYLSPEGERQCPQTGCSQTFSRDRFNEEFCLDEAMSRRINRERQAQEALRDMDENDDDDEDQSVVLGAARQIRVKPERVVEDEEQEESEMED